MIGALLEVEREHDRDEGYELRYGPLLQSAWGPLQANLNLLFERRLRARGEQTPTEMGYQWQWRWRRDASFDWGMQGFGALGRWDGWASSATTGARARAGAVCALLRGGRAWQRRR